MNSLGVFDSRYAKAYVSPGDETQATFVCEASDLETALSREYETDAHFCMYSVTGEKAWPRLKKTSLRGIEILGQDVEIQYLCIDWDLPDHKPWDLASFNEFWEKLELIQSTFPLLSKYSAIYTTAHGAHIVWTLDTATTPNGAECMLKGLAARLRSEGLQVDDLHDWTRLMRCPSVVRGSAPTWEAEPFHLIEFQDSTVSPDEVPTLEVRAKTGAEAEELDEDRPLPRPFAEDSPLLEQARRRLTGRECYDAIFGRKSPDSFGNPGQRNNRIFHHVGQATGLLFPAGDFDERGIYQLFRHAVSQCEHTSGKEEPLDQLWRAVKTSWVREAAQDQETKRAVKQEMQAEETLWGDICKGFLEWAILPGVRDESAARSFLQDKLILITPNGGSMIMTPNGYYDRVEVSKSQLISRVRQIGMTQLINCYKAKTTKHKASQEVMDIYGFPVNGVAAGPEYDKGTTVLGLDSGLPTAVLPMFQKNREITAKYDADVDLWLRKLCKSDRDYHKLTEWLSYCLDFSKPIAALALVGASGVGKKMLMLGISECFMPPKIADFTNLVAGFGDVLLETPLIWANEGFPQNQGRGKRVADLIRELVAGDPISINRKFKTSVQIQANFRIVVTANNDACLTNLYAGQDLTSDDRAAIARRIVHIEASANARMWLQSKGGLAYTGKPGHRWVSNQTGGVSDFVVARHILHLFENRKPVAKGARFAVEGQVGYGTLVDDMALASGVAPKVVETLFALSEAETVPDGLKIIRQDEDLASRGVYVTVSCIKTAYRKLPFAKTTDTLTDKNIANVLLSLCDTHGVLNIDEHKAHWYKLNLSFLFAQAINSGAKIGRIFSQFENES